MPILSVVREVRASRTILSVRGELDLATVGVLRAEVQDVLSGMTGQLVLDLSGTEFIDSTGSRELARAAKAGGSAGVAVIAVVPAENSRVRRVLDFMDFGDLLPVHESLPPE